MAASSRLPHLILPLIFLLLTPSALACDSQRLVLETCSIKFDCIGNLDPLVPTLCFGRNQSQPQSNQLVQCPNQDVDGCVCYPLGGFRHCVDNNDCPDEMYCGISGKTGNKLCVGCLTLGNPNVNFKPVKPDPTRCAAQHPPCGRGLDFCSKTMPCAGDYKCIHIVNGKSFLCGSDQSPCQCFYGTNVKISLAECTSNSDCKDEREACVWDVSTNRNLCASCDAVRDSQYLIANDTSKCDALPTTRPAPRSYVDSSNGRTFDVCLSDVQCTGDRKCVQFKDGPEKPSLLEPCSGPSKLCFCRPKTLVKCKSAADCDRGESCATAEQVGAITSCVSNSFLDTISRESFTVISKERPNGSGKGLDLDNCKFDWNCKPPRRCTAINEAWGGCAGRGACLCRRLTHPPCKSNKNCTDGEVCVEFVGGRTRPFCASPKALEAYDYLKSVSAPAVTPTPVATGFGLIQDPCLTDDDCIAPRVCRHRTETISSCDGRPQCLCYKEANKCNTTIADCPIGEVCTAFKGAFPLNAKCVSEAAFDSDIYPFRFVLGKRHTKRFVPPSATPSSSTTPSSSDQRTDLGISASEPPEENAEPSGSDPSMTAVPGESVSTTADNDDRGVDAGDDNDVTDNDPAQATDEAGPPICVDAKLLGHLSRERLVFKEHRRGAVLCDHMGSCATPGHMVTFKKTAMSMRTYCSAHAVCQKRSTWVNSPRMTSGLRIKSHTNELQMTAFAARYESWAEEILLKQIIHLGI